jgi:RNA polymerase sigma-70 factor (ECF subfamily)
MSRRARREFVQRRGMRCRRQAVRMATRWDWGQARDLCYREARRVTRDAVLAEDAAQDALLRAWRARATCRTPEAPDAWLAAIARNVAITALRRQRRWDRAVALHDGEDAAADPAAERALAQATERAGMDLALGVLPQADRVLLCLRYEHDLTQPEIARRLGVPEGTVKARLHRLRARLRRELAP